MHLRVQSRCILRTVSSLDEKHLYPLTTAGMLHKVGLLPKDNEELVRSNSCLFQCKRSLTLISYELYKQGDKHGFEQSKSFKETFCGSVEIEFVSILVPYLNLRGSNVGSSLVSGTFGEIDCSLIQHLLGIRQVNLFLLCVLELLTSLTVFVGGHPLRPQLAFHVHSCTALTRTQSSL